MVHWTFLLLPIWLAYTNVRTGHGWEVLLWNIVFIVAVFFCVTLHEFGHALMARRFKYKTKDITLLPIGGVARMEELPENPRQELLVAIAGPLVNFVIAGLLYLLSLYSNTAFNIQGQTVVGPENFLFFLMAVNLVLGLFNLIPAFPMDGGRVLRALLSFKISRHMATFIAARFGQFIAILFAVLGVFYNPFLILIAIFIFLGAQAEFNMVHSKYMLADHTVGEMVMHKYNVIDANDSLRQATALLLDSDSVNFLVMDNGQIVGTLTSAIIMNSLSTCDEHIPVSQVMNRKLKIVTPNTRLSEIFMAKHEPQKSSIMPVVEEDRLLGVIDIDNILEFLMIQQARVQRQKSNSLAQ